MRRKLSEDEKFMREAIKEARKAEKIGEVPIGCVIGKDKKIVARGYNKGREEGNTLAHAEIKAIDKACKKTGDWRLEGCSMYVTLEPCPMCAGALVQSRIDKVYIGCMNPKAGCAGSVLDMFSVEGFNHQIECERGVLGEECSEMLKTFFKDLRKRLKEEKQAEL